MERMAAAEKIKAMKIRRLRAPPQSNEVDCHLMERLIDARSCVRSFQTNTEPNYNHTDHQYAVLSTDAIIVDENEN